MKRIISMISIISLLTFIMTLVPTAVLAQGDITCESSVVVQADDWLSKIADKFYGDPLAYQVIADTTNAKAESDESYAKIDNVDIIEPGWKLCIPGVAEAQIRLSGLNLTPQRGGTLRVAIQEPMTSIDPHRLNGVGDLLISGLMSQPLVAGNSNDEIVPVLAESWTSENDGRTYIFKLRQGVKFHNGQEMTANEVKWSIDRQSDPNAGTILQSVFKSMGVTTTVIDKYTIRVDIESGRGAFLSHLAQAQRVAILHPDSVDADGNLVKPIGTGPFKLVDWTPGVEVKLERFEDYWQLGADGKPLPYLDGVTITIAPDATTRLNALLGDEQDFIIAPPLVDVKQWVDTEPPEGIKFIKWFYNFSNYISLNARRPPFDDVRVRQAVRYTIDRDAINEALFFGLGEVHNQPFKKTSRWYVDVPTVKPDLDKARSLMAEAGLSDGVDVRMLVWSPLLDQLAEVVQAELAQIGIRAKLDKMDVGSMVKEMTFYEWDIGTLIIGTIFHPDRPYAYLESEHGSHPYVGGYDDPQLNALLDAARDEPDFQKAKDMYRTIVEKYIEEVGTPQYLTNQPLVAAFKDNVVGFNAYGYDLVSINGEMGLHKTWIRK